MRQFHVWHLLLLTTVFAMTFGVARLLDYEMVLAAMVVFGLFAPCVCYGVAEVVAGSRRTFRRLLRHSLLVLVILAFVSGCTFLNATSWLPLLVFTVLLLWVPQLIVLRICSANRASLAGSLI